MKKITIMGGGAWGSTLGQVLTDNQHQVLIYDNNETYINKINNQQHPIFDLSLENIVATTDLEKALNFADIIVLCIPAQKMRTFLQQINPLLKKPKSFINTSKGIETNSNKMIFQITKEEIDPDKLKNYASLLGPSHAEEVILRRITFLLSSSDDKVFSEEIVEMFSNSYYLKINASDDVMGSELCSAFKNALSLVSGILDNEDFQTNAKAAFISLGIIEMKKVLEVLDMKTDIVLELSSLGDFIVTAFNENSRNYQAGKKIRLGIDLNDIYANSFQTIEGANNLKVFYDLSIEKNISLPIIQSAYQVVFEKKPLKNILSKILETK
ncbi:NAD(P)H-dependent glycerol-3-phosphate dehydrogenase [Vaccinium witches'-broom phytoplasma]|uniref:NAD(P)H-dependent glycerol-3-phosphate dehydrogenase n=1 Tax=Vaccinium witches'-broom phytoplasma TaxID=85642 RepID=UPI00037E370B|nr:NAD(P)H-dependent glycerol-3-phosphate dehydrogenase [Vaccinium witches'-broom phytoplasma]